jgi:hypothetical protein
MQSAGQTATHWGSPSHSSQVLASIENSPLIFNTEPVGQAGLQSPQIEQLSGLMVIAMVASSFDQA